MEGIFVAASRMGDDDQADTRDTFVQTYDEATQVWGLSESIDRSLLDTSVGVSDP